MFKTDQENFWAQEFGDRYIHRNQGEQLLASNLNFFSKALSSIEKPTSILEFGANIGMNLRALQHLFPAIEMSAIEINELAAAHLEEVVSPSNIYRGSILDYQPHKVFDICLIKGVLIHINPSHLTNVYENLYHSSDRFILIAEYYNPSPVELMYRGETGKLFKRDFAGEMMDRFPDLSLRDYGFFYHRDPKFPQDDITYFLLEK